MTNDEHDETVQIDYFARNAMPYMVGHLEMRSRALQIFTAIQGGLMYAWTQRPHWFLAVIGLASCLSIFLWDSRNRYIFRILRELGEKTVDRPVFGTGEDGKARTGVHRLMTNTLAASGRWFPWCGKKVHFASHTWAIRIMLLSAFAVWVALVVCVFV